MILRFPRCETDSVAAWFHVVAVPWSNKCALTRTPTATNAWKQINYVFVRSRGSLISRGNGKFSIDIHGTIDRYSSICRFQRQMHIIKEVLLSFMDPEEGQNNNRSRPLFRHGYWDYCCPTRIRCYTPPFHCSPTVVTIHKHGVKDGL